MGVGKLLIGVGTSAELPLLTALSDAGPGGGTDVGHFCGINAFQCLSVLAVIGALRASGYGLATASK